MARRLWWLLAGGVAVLAVPALLALNSRDSEDRLLNQASTGATAERLRAVDALVQHRSDRVAERLKILAHDPEPAVAARVVLALGAQATPQDAPLFREAARSEQVAVREAAVVALGRCGSDADVPALIVTLRDRRESPDVRAAAAGALGQIMVWDAGMEALLAALRDEDAGVRAAAGAAITRIMKLDFGFHANAPVAQREAVIGRIEASWRDYEVGFRGSKHPRPGG